MTTQWDRINLKLKNTQLKVARAAIIDLGTAVIMGTPVDKGFLINAWNTSINTDDVTLRKPALGGVDSYNQLILKVDDLTSGSSLHFINPLPYANRIEYEGHSQKAPQGMLRRNTVKWSMFVDDAAKRFGND